MLVYHHPCSEGSPNLVAIVYLFTDCRIPDEFLHELQTSKFVKSVQRKHDLRSGGQPRMFHLSLVLENNLESPRLKRAVFGLTAPSWWTHDALKDWSRESRQACLSEDEKEMYTARRQKPKQQFDKLRAVEDGRRDPVLRLQTIKDLQGEIEGCSRRS